MTLLDGIHEGEKFFESEAPWKNEPQRNLFGIV